MVCKSIPMVEFRENCYVDFGEAINWIAHQNFAGATMGPLDMHERFLIYLRDRDDFSTSADACERLAAALLHDRAARGLIRIYAMSSWLQEQEDDTTTYLTPPILLSTEFLIGAQYYVRKEEEEVEIGLYHGREVYSDLLVDAEELTREFWGGHLPRKKPTWHWELVKTVSHAVTSPIQQVIGVPQRQPHAPDTASLAAGNFTRRRGRPPRYFWQAFAAEMVRRAIQDPPSSQAEFERQMAEWCQQSWGAEPAISMIREYVAPAFAAMQQGLGGRPTNGAGSLSA